VIGHFIEWGIRSWVRLFGREIKDGEAAWLHGPIGSDQPIGGEIYRQLSESEGLTMRTNHPGSGLMADFLALSRPGFDASTVDEAVREFYERSSHFTLDSWAEWSGLFRPLGALLVSTVSHRIQQLNLPTSSLATSRGMSNEVIQLLEPDTGTIRYTGWFRSLKQSGDIIYAGFYSICTPPRAAGPCVKVVFPLPLGSATVILRPERDAQGRFQLVSSGVGFGDAGFYRIHATGTGTRKVRLLRAMKEQIVVYVDEEGVLRTDHHFRFFRLPILNLHYRIRPNTR
jgi:hypothetical protein